MLATGSAPAAAAAAAATAAIVGMWTIATVDDMPRVAATFWSRGQLDSYVYVVQNFILRALFLLFD